MDIQAVTNTVHLSSGTTEKAAPVVHTPTPAPVAAVAPAPIPSADQVKQAVQDINKALQRFSQSVEFSVDETNGHTIVKVVDQNTQEIIRQMPSLEALEIAASA